MQNKTKKKINQAIISCKYFFFARSTFSHDFDSNDPFLLSFRIVILVYFPHDLRQAYDLFAINCYHKKKKKNNKKRK